MRKMVKARDYNTCQVCGDVTTNRKIVDYIHRLKSSPDEKLKFKNIPPPTFQYKNSINSNFCSLAEQILKLLE